MSGAAAAFPFEEAIAARAQAAGIELSSAGAAALAAHARLVLERNPLLHLTAITSPDDFVERHIGEAFEGAALLPPVISGTLVDLGSGNGYPGIPLALARSGLIPILAESNRRKSAFLRDALAVTGLAEGAVLERSVQKASDLDDVPEAVVFSTRAMSGWERIVPKLVSRLSNGGIVLLWTGAGVESIVRRAAWSRLRVDAVRTLPGRQRAWVTRLSLS